jgi:hypothetical protein
MAATEEIKAAPSAFGASPDAPKAGFACSSNGNRTMAETAVSWLYGLLPPLDWDEECEREASAGQRHLWNALVAIEQERRAGEDCLCRSDRRLGQIMERLDAIERRLAEMPRRGTTEAERAEHRTLRAEQSALRGEANPLRKAVRRTRAADFRILLGKRSEMIVLA